MRKTSAPLLAVLCAAAYAGTYDGSTTVTVFGVSREVHTWDVRADAASVDPFEPEDMTFYNGRLYAAGDHNESEGRLVYYEPGVTGDLSSPAYYQMARTNDIRNTLWGPEGLTVNTSGVGYGSWTAGEPQFVSVDSNGDDRMTVIDLNLDGFGEAPVVQITAVPDPDDIAYLPGGHKFVLLNDRGTDGIFCQFWNFDDTGLTTLDHEFRCSDDEIKGLCVISAATANCLLGRTDLTGQYLLMISTPGIVVADNYLWVYELDGTVLGQSLFDPLSATEMEAVAVDESNLMIYVGDEGGFRIHAFQCAPAATLSGHVNLQNFTDPNGQTATIEFRTPGTTTVEHSYPITLDGSGDYSAGAVAEGTFDVAVKFPHWLRDVVASVTVSTGPNTVDFTQVNGDANGDNSVNLLDINEVLLKFGQPDAMADLDGDGTTALQDLNLCLLNFGLSGQP